MLQDARNPIYNNHYILSFHLFLISLPYFFVYSFARSYSRLHQDLSRSYLTTSTQFDRPLADIDFKTTGLLLQQDPRRTETEVKSQAKMASSTPLARTFLISRGLSGVAMVSIVGMTAHFVSQLVSSNIDPPREIVGTLTVVSPYDLSILRPMPKGY